MGATTKIVFTAHELKLESLELVKQILGAR